MIEEIILPFFIVFSLQYQGILAERFCFFNQETILVFLNLRLQGLIFNPQSSHKARQSTRTLSRVCGTCYLSPFLLISTKKPWKCLPEWKGSFCTRRPARVCTSSLSSPVQSPVIYRPWIIPLLFLVYASPPPSYYHTRTRTLNTNNVRNVFRPDSNNHASARLIAFKVLR